MTEKKSSQDQTPSAGGSAAGRKVGPLPHIEPAPPEPGAPVQEIPIGVPVDPTEFRRLKAEAERRSPIDVEEEAGTRRVHWTIVKRTTADQISRKPISALYVLQRDGADSEFPSLGAARNEVNKTIVHPEKLTRSKAEYAAEKK